MSELQLRAVADAAGRIRLDLTAPHPLRAYNVRVVLAPGDPPEPTPEELGWSRDFLENVLGSIDDDTFVAPDRGRPAPTRPSE